MIRRRKQKVRLQAMTRMLNYIICNDSDDCMQFLKQTEAFLTNFVSTTRKTKQICAITNMPTLEQNKKKTLYSYASQNGNSMLCEANLSIIKLKQLKRNEK